MLIIMGVDALKGPGGSKTVRRLEALTGALQLSCESTLAVLTLDKEVKKSVEGAARLSFCGRNAGSEIAQGPGELPVI